MLGAHKRLVRTPYRRRTASPFGEDDLLGRQLHNRQLGVFTS